jgi:asparagine synthase (glutamine-hydrolysing)
MCGIAGALAAGPIDPAVVARMRDAVAHRGPDHAGLWRSEDGRVCLGHRRLAIIDLDARSNQPMVSYDGRFVLTFNGEIYNYREVRRVLEGEGGRFRTDSDTEVLIEAYRRWGADALDRLSGMFAFALWDAEARRLFCARDRAGEKPFYYARVGGAFVFGSEIKAILEWPDAPRRLDHEALVDYLALGFIADPKSIWRDIRKLPPAHSMSVRLEVGQVSVDEPRRYWGLQFEDAGPPPSPEEIRATILKAANEMAVADVPLGAFLSGGVDSSTVAAALSLSGHDVRAFTIGFEHAAYDERPWARVVAQRYASGHVERVVDPADVAAVLDRLNWHYDEPFNDYSSFPTYYLCREARGSITVALSGDGADELFAGYRKYQRLARRAELGRALPLPAARAAAAVARRALPEGGFWRRTLTQYALSAPQMLADMLCIGMPLDMLRSVARGELAETLRHYDPVRLVDQLLADAPPERVGLVNAMRRLDFDLTLPGDMLVKVDRASMAVALEVRPLFLHREVMELAARTPAPLLADTQVAKLALKNAVSVWLPNDLLERRKQGFALPLPEWLAGDTALDARLAPGADAGPLGELLDLGQVAGFRDAHRAGKGNYTAVVQGTFMLDRWFSRWLPN